MKPTTIKALKALLQVDILRKPTGRKRDRVYTCHRCLQVLTEDTA